MIVCMPQTVAGSGLECHDFCRRRGFEERQAISYEATLLFSPSAPVDERNLFAGRSEQIRKLIETVSERGKHVVLYGERGVGKTSLANVVRFLFPTLIRDILVIREQIDPTDNFSSIWKKVFKDVTVTSRVNGKDINVPLSDFYEGIITPDDVRREMTNCFFASQLPIVIVDEFDKAQDEDLRPLIANLIKSLSDYSVNITIILVGVADDVGDLVGENESIARCIEQIHMPRMSNIEMREILEKRIPQLGLTIHIDALWKIITLARGLPSYVHLLGMYAVQDAAKHRSSRISEEHVDAAINRVLSRSQESIQREYAAAVHTNRTDTLFREVLLACALAIPDDRGVFTPKAVVGPLTKILDREIKIANFQNHLKKFI